MFFSSGFLSVVFLPLLPPGEHPASSKSRPRARGAAFAHVTPRSVESVVVLLGKLGEEFVVPWMGERALSSTHRGVTLVASGDYGWGGGS